MPEDLREAYPAQPSTPAMARSAIAGYLDAHGLDELIPTAALLVSELITNAVVHSHEPITLRARYADHTLHVDIDDASTEPPQLNRPVAPSAQSGRGLHLVTELSRDWGFTSPTGHGKTIWFELEG